MRLEGKRIVALFLSLQHVTLGFAPIHPPSKTGVSTPLTKLASDASSDQNEPDVVPYGEQSRSYRRDVFGYEDWLRHRRSDRFLYNLSTIPSSGLWRQVKEELWTVFGISSLVVLWNALFCYGYTDLDGVFWNPIVYPSFPELQLPIMPFQLLVPSLSLLLVFRTNASYGRWAEARQQWSTMETECRNIMRMAAAWSSPSREPSREARIQAIRGVGDGCFVFLRSLLRHVSGPDDEEDYLRDIAFLPAQEADAISAAANRPFRALYYLSRKVEALPLSERQRVELDKACVIIGDTCGGTERIYGTPVPTSYSRHTSRFATVWLFLLPFGLYEPFEFTWNHVGLIPVTVLISAFLFIIEELSIQLEEPFSVLALPNIVSDVQAFANQLPQWHAMYTNEEFNSKVYGGEEVPTNFKVGRYNKYSRPKPRSRPIPDDGEDLPFFVKFKWMMSKVPDAGPTLDTAPYYSFSLSEEAGNLLKDMENDEDFSYTPSFEDFIDIPQQRREFTIRQMQELVNEMGTLEKMVRGQDQQLVGIRSSLKELGDRAIKLKDRSTGRTIEVTDIPPLDTAVSGNNDAGTEQSSAIDEISDDMMSDVKSIEDMVKATNTDIGDLRDRIESLQSKADAAKTRASSESSNEASVTPGDTTSRISKEEVEYEESLSNALMMSGELRDDLLCLRNEFDNKFNEVQSLQNRIHTLQDVAHNLQTRVNENSASGEDIEYFIRNQRKKLEIEREEHLIESSATPNGVNKSGTPEPAIPQPVAKINCNASNGSSGDQVISLASEYIKSSSSPSLGGNDHIIDSCELTIQEMQDLVREIGSLEKLVRGNDSDLISIISNMNALKDKTKELKGRYNFVVDAQRSSELLKVSNGDDMSANNFAKIMKPDVQSIESLVKSVNMDLLDLRERVDVLQRKAKAAKSLVTDTLSDSLQEPSAGMEDMAYSETLTKTLSMSTDLRDELFFLRQKFSVKVNELQSLEKRALHVRNRVESLQSRSQLGSSKEEDIEAYIRDERKKLDEKRDAQVINTNTSTNVETKTVEDQTISMEEVRAMTEIAMSMSKLQDQVLAQVSDLDGLKNRLASNKEKAKNLIEKASFNAGEKRESIEDFIENLREEVRVSEDMKTLSSMASEVQTVMSQLKRENVGLESLQTILHSLGERIRGLQSRNIVNDVEELNDIEDFILEFRAQESLMLLNNMRNEVMTMTQELATKHNELDIMQRRLDEQNDKTRSLIDSATSSLSSNKKESEYIPIDQFISQLQEERDARKSIELLQKMQNEVQSLTSQMQNQVVEIGSIRERLSDSDAKARKLQTKAQATAAIKDGSIEAYIEELRDAQAMRILQTMESEIYTMMRQVRDQNDDLGDIRKRIDDQEAKVNLLKQRGTSSESEPIDIEDFISVLRQEQDSTKLSSLMGHVKNQISTQVSELDELKRRLSSSTQRAKKLVERGGDDLSENSVSIEDFIQNLRDEQRASENIKQLESMAGEVRGLRTQFEQKGSDLSTLQSNLQSLGDRMKQLKIDSDSDVNNSELSIEDFIVESRAHQSLKLLGDMKEEVQSMISKLGSENTELDKIRERVNGQEEKTRSLIDSATSSLSEVESIEGFISNLQEERGLRHDIESLQKMQNEVQSLTSQMQNQVVEIGSIRERLSDSDAKARKLQTKAQATAAIKDGSIEAYIEELRDAQAMRILQTMESEIYTMMRQVCNQNDDLGDIRKRIDDQEAKVNLLKQRGTSSESEPIDIDEFIVTLRQDHDAKVMNSDVSSMISQMREQRDELNMLNSRMHTLRDTSNELLKRATDCVSDSDRYEDVIIGNFNANLIENEEFIGNDNDSVELVKMSNVPSNSERGHNDINESSQLTISQMQELVNEMGILEDLVRGQDDELVKIRSSLTHLTDRANGLKDRCADETVTQALPIVESQTPKYNESDSIQSDVESLEGQVNSMNTDIYDLRERIETLHSKALATKTRVTERPKVNGLLDPSPENVVTKREIGSKSIKDGHDKSLSSALSISKDMRDDLQSLKRQYDSKYDEVLSLKHQINSLKDKANSLQSRCESTESEDIEVFIRSQRKKLDEKRDQHAIDAVIVTSSMEPHDTTDIDNEDSTIPAIQVETMTQMADAINQLQNQVLFQIPELDSLKQRLSDNTQRAKVLAEKANVGNEVGGCIEDFILNLREEQRKTQNMKQLESMANDVLTLRNQFQEKNSDLSSLQTKVFTLGERLQQLHNDCGMDDYDSGVTIEDFILESRAHQSLKLLHTVKSEVQNMLNQFGSENIELGSIKQRITNQGKKARALLDKVSKGDTQDISIDDFIAQLKENQDVQTSLQVLQKMQSEVQSMVSQIEKQVMDLDKIRSRLDHSGGKAQNLKNKIKSKLTGEKIDIEEYLSELRASQAMKALKAMEVEILAMMHQVRDQDIDLDDIRQRIHEQDSKLISLQEQSSSVNQNAIDGNGSLSSLNQSHSSKLVKSEVTEMRTQMNQQRNVLGSLKGRMQDLHLRASALKESTARRRAESHDDVDIEDFIANLKEKKRQRMLENVEDAQVITLEEVSSTNDEKDRIQPVINIDNDKKNGVHNNVNINTEDNGIHNNVNLNEGTALVQGTDKSDKQNNGRRETKLMKGTNERVAFISAEVQSMTDRIRTKTSELESARKTIEKLSDRSRHLNNRR